MNKTTKNIRNAFNDCVKHLKKSGKENMQRRELDLHIFDQEWSTTALGFDDFMAGQAFTTADTIIIFGPKKDVCVYFDGRFAYYVENPNSKFFDDFVNKNMTNVKNKHIYED